MVRGLQRQSLRVLSQGRATTPDTYTQHPPSVPHQEVALGHLTFVTFSCSSPNKLCCFPKEALFYSEFSEHFFKKQK